MYVNGNHSFDRSRPRQPVVFVDLEPMNVCCLSGKIISGGTATIGIPNELVPPGVIRQKIQHSATNVSQSEWSIGTVSTEVRISQHKRCPVDFKETTTTTSPFEISKCPKSQR